MAEQDPPRARAFTLVVKAPPGSVRPTNRAIQIGYEEITAEEAKAHAEKVFGRPVLSATPTARRAPQAK